MYAGKEKERKAFASLFPLKEEVHNCCSEHYHRACKNHFHVPEAP
jgi:hypothetical protein